MFPTRSTILAALVAATLQPASVAAPQGDVRQDWLVAPSDQVDAYRAHFCQGLPGGGAVVLFSVGPHPYGPASHVELRRVGDDGATRWSAEIPVPNMSPESAPYAVHTDPLGRTLLAIGEGSSQSLRSYGADGALLWQRTVDIGDGYLLFPRDLLRRRANGDVTLVARRIATASDGVRLIVLDGATGADRVDVLLPCDGRPSVALDSRDSVHVLERLPAPAGSGTMDVRYRRIARDGSVAADATHTLAISADTNLSPEIVGDPQGDFVIGRGGPGRELVFSIDRDGALEWSTTVGPDVTPVGVVLTSDEYLVVDRSDGSRQRFGRAGALAVSAPEPLLENTGAGLTALRDGGYVFVRLSGFSGVARFTADDQLMWNRGDHVGDRVVPVSESLDGRVLVAGHEVSFFFLTNARVRQYVEEAVEPSSLACAQTVPNSTGRTGKLQAFGSTDLARNDLSLLFHDLPPSQFVLLLDARAEATVPGAGGSLGTLCLGGPIGRFPQIELSTGVGTVRRPLDLGQLPTPNALVPVQAGETWFFQGWHRDFAQGPTSNFTDAVEVVF